MFPVGTRVLNTFDTSIKVFISFIDPKTENSHFVSLFHLHNNKIGCEAISSCLVPLFKDKSSCKSKLRNGLMAGIASHFLQRKCYLIDKLHFREAATSSLARFHGFLILRLRVIHLLLSPSSETQKKPARKNKWPREILGVRSTRKRVPLFACFSSPGSRTHELSERGTTCNLPQLHWSWNLEMLVLKGKDNLNT